MGWEERFRLDGKVAVVTGASYGLGATFATSLADAGAEVDHPVVRVHHAAPLEDLEEARGKALPMARVILCRAAEVDARFPIRQRNQISMTSSATGSACSRSTRSPWV